MAKKKRCKDCDTGVNRPCPFPGPRCSTHHREALEARREAAHDKMVQRVYGLLPGQYAKLYAAQGGVCYICKRATGKTKRLSVDHDHKTGYVRGLLCTTCNKILGHLRDDAERAYAIYGYLTDPPAFKVIGMMRPNE